jgi:hypothetical protein
MRPGPQFWAISRADVADKQVTMVSVQQLDNSSGSAGEQGAVGAA